MKPPLRLEMVIEIGRYFHPIADTIAQLHFQMGKRSRRLLIPHRSISVPAESWREIDNEGGSSSIIRDYDHELLELCLSVHVMETCIESP